MVWLIYPSPPGPPSLPSIPSHLFPSLHPSFPLLLRYVHIAWRYQEVTGGTEGYFVHSWLRVHRVFITFLLNAEAFLTQRHGHGISSLALFVFSSLSSSQCTKSSNCVLRYSQLEQERTGRSTVYLCRWTVGCWSLTKRKFLEKTTTSVTPMVHLGSTFLAGYCQGIRKWQDKFGKFFLFCE